MTQLINGQPIAHVDMADRGLAYGDGLFETMVCTHLKLHHWNAHWQRLCEGLTRLNFSYDAHNLKKLLEDDISQLLYESSTSQSVIKIIITRGVSQRGYQSDNTAPLTRIVQWSAFPSARQKYAQQGIKVSLCQHKWSHNKALEGLKHLNRLDQVLARQEWQDDSIQEGIMLNQQGNIQSGVMSNVFVQLNQMLYTPVNDGAGIRGVMADYIKRQAKTLGIGIEEKNLPLSMTEQADAMFMCNSINGIWPVVQFEQHHYPISPLTRQLQAACTSDKP